MGLNRFFDEMADRGLVAKEDKALYAHGFVQLLFMLLNLVATLLIGWLFGNVFFSLVFVAAYIILRTNAGGYHASTYFRCFLVSSLMMVGVMILAQAIDSSFWVYHLLLVSGCLTIWLMAPVEDVNKPLDQIEQIVYRKRSRRTVIFLSLVYVCGFCFSIEIIVQSLSLSAFTVGTMMVVGKYKHNWKKLLHSR